MKNRVLSIVGVLTALTQTSPVMAFPARGPQNIADLQEPLPSDATKRTYEFMKTFGVPSYEVDYQRCDEAADEFRLYVVAYNDRLDRFLAGATEPRKLKADRTLFKRGFRRLDRRIANHMRRYDEIGAGPAYSSNTAFEEKVCTGKTAFYNLLAMREAVVAIGRIYPDMEEVAPALQSLDAAIAKIGDEEQIKRHIRSNLAAALEDVRMQPARTSNAEWEANLRQRFSRQFPDRSVIKLHLMGNWNVKRHWLTNRPIYRRLGSWIANKGPDGTCYVTTYAWRQTASAGGFNGDRFERNGEIQILCKNI